MEYYGVVGWPKLAEMPRLVLRKMPDLNIRNVDESLMRELKAKAAVDGYTLRDYAIKALWSAVSSKPKPAPVPNPQPDTPIIKSVAEPKKEKSPYCRHGLAFCQTCRMMA